MADIVRVGSIGYTRRNPWGVFLSPDRPRGRGLRVDVPDIVRYGTCRTRPGRRFSVAPARTDRIEARVAPDRAERIRYAASLVGASMSAFVVDAAAEKAERVIAQERETVVPAEFFDQLLSALDGPATAVPALRRAARRARRTVAQR